MSFIALPEPDAPTMGRRDAIVKELERLVGADGVIADEDGRRAFETDGLTAYKRMPLAVVLPRTTDGGLPRACLLPRPADQGDPARRRHLAVRWRAAHRGRGCRRRLAHEPRDRHRLCQPHGDRGDGHHQPRHLRRRRGPRLLLRARPFEPARLHAGRQPRHELRRRPLPEIRRHHQQRARPQDGADRRRGRRDRRTPSRCRRLRPARPDRRLGRPVRHRHRGDRAHPAAGRSRTPGHDRICRQRGGRPVRLRHHRLGHHPRRHRVHGQARDPRLRSRSPRPAIRWTWRRC